MRKRIYVVTLVLLYFMQLLHIRIYKALLMNRRLMKCRILTCVGDRLSAKTTMLYITILMHTLQYIYIYIITEMSLYCHCPCMNFLERWCRHPFRIEHSISFHWPVRGKHSNDVFCVWMIIRTQWHLIARDLFLCLNDNVHTKTC